MQRLVAFFLYIFACAGSFVTRRGSALYDGDFPFRFGGCNLYWLGLDENEGGVHYPTPFRIRDGLTTAAGMGCTLVRGHTLGISTGSALSFEPALGVFNGSALDAADFAISVADELGLRLIIPLTDNWRYYHGGKHSFTDWLGLPSEEDFYSDSRAVAAFEAYIAARLAHVSSYTGRAARDEPAIAFWETGNELRPPTSPPSVASWTERIAAFIKAADGNHLVLDGTDGVVAAHATASVDALSDHFYPVDAARLAAGAAAAAAAGRVYIAGEYGWTSGDVPGFLVAAAANSNVSGTAFWSLFPHADTSGFVNHSDGFTVHYDPGGGNAAMNAFLGLFEAHSAAMRGLPAPPAPPAPGAPAVLSAAAGVLAWRGAALAEYYDVRVSPLNAGGPWQPICACAAGCDALCITDDDSPLAINSTLAPPGGWVMIGSVGAGGATGAWAAPVQMAA